MKKLILLFTFIVAACASASAAPVVLTPAENAAFVFGALDFTGVAPQNTANLGAGNYSVQWNVTADGFAVTQSSLLTLGAPRGSIGDTFAFTIVNNDGNPWNFAVALNGGAPSSTQSIPNNGGSFTFNFILPAGGLTSVRLIVGQTLPINGDDRGAEYHIGPTAVPEPTSMLLLGTGLVGLAGAARRRFKGSL